MSYLDIDHILAEEERLPCLFNVDANNMGVLDPSIRSPHLLAGSKVDMPLWLAQVLGKSHDNYHSLFILPHHVYDVKYHLI